MNRRMVSCCTAMAIFGLIFIVGCGGGGPERCKVTGTVTLDGQPLETGEVLFLPADGQGPSDACQIVAGSFEGEVAPGSKKVEITATKEVPPAEAGGMPDYINLVPAQYNTQTTLTADIKDGGEALTFELEGGS